jgi:RimJ/RimL family protein N-acetyltransferase
MEQTILRKHNHTLEYADVRLRPMLEDDFNIMAEKWTSPEVLYYSESDDVQSYSADDLKEIYKTASGAFCFIIEYRNKPIGDCWLQKNNCQHLIDQYPNIDSRRIDIVIGEKE